VLLDPADRALLVRWRLGDRDVWGTPGGGVDPGETHADAVRRELLEETGLDLPPEAVGPVVGRRRHVFPMGAGYAGRWDGQEEWFYLVRVDAFEPRGTLSDVELRSESLHELRWCDIAEVRSLVDEDAPRPVLTAPRALADLLARLVRDGHPGQPLELEV
jgi:8-oxo-dGTP pyrophosphatase MutT (NUDIX family)